MNKEEIEEQFQQAGVHNTSGEYEECFSLLVQCAEYGHFLSAHMVGQFYRDGIGVEIDMQKAIDWYLKSIELGFEEGYYYVAFACWQAGDKGKAQYYFDIAAKDNEVLALSYLGYAYMGLNDWDEFNIDKAIHYHKRAADLGIIMSEVAYCRLLLEGYQGFSNRFLIIPKLLKAICKLYWGYLSDNRSIEMCIQSTALARKLDSWDRFD